MGKSKQVSVLPPQAARPESTSAEALDSYVSGRCVRSSRGEAWRGIRAAVHALPPSGMTPNIPAVNEPVLVWVSSGEIEVFEREGNDPWIRSLVKKHSFFLTIGGAPYDCKWRTLSTEPFEYLLVSLEMPLLQRAFTEVFGASSSDARLRNLSAFTDPLLSVYMEQIQAELLKKEASALLVQGLAQLIAVHLARHYAEIDRHFQSGSPSLPGFKLRKVTEWMAQHLAEEANLEDLAALVGLSKFHFHRLFKSAMGVSPSRYQLTLRMDLARKLLRETRRSIVDIALEAGYANPSHFTQVFRRETGLAPSEYRRQQ